MPDHDGHFSDLSNMTRPEHWFLRLCARINALCYHWDNYQRLAAAEKAQGDMSRQWLDAEQEAADLREQLESRQEPWGQYPDLPKPDETVSGGTRVPVRTIGQREPGQRGKAPTWKQYRYRVADEGHGLDRIKAPFGMTEGQARRNRARILTTGELADRFDRATQAAREIADELDTAAGPRNHNGQE